MPITNLKKHMMATTKPTAKNLIAYLQEQENYLWKEKRIVTEIYGKGSDEERLALREWVSIANALSNFGIPTLLDLELEALG